MSFEESALVRLRRYRGEGGRSVGLVREAEEAARHFSGRLFDGLKYTAALGREVGFEVETAHEEVLTLRVSAGPGAEAEATFGLLGGAAAETDEDLMHEELSRYDLDPSGYSGCILGWSGQVGEGATARSSPSTGTASGRPKASSWRRRAAGWTTPTKS